MKAIKKNKKLLELIYVILIDLVALSF